MVSPLSKLANPWKCDAPGCGILRANDANHWLIVSIHTTEQLPAVPYVVVSRWQDQDAEIEGVKHACGIGDALKLAGELIQKHFFPAEISLTGKDVASGD